VIQRHRAILLLLTALNLLNYVDRYLVVGVGPPLQKSLGLNDGQFGDITSAFMFGYFLTSPLFGWLGDRYPRKGLIAAGIVVWSLATALSGLTTTYGQMIAARVIVGVGEASYATLGPTIIDDISTRESKNRWLSIFYVAIPVGSALGFLIGGQLAERFGWRYAFFIGGGPGLALAAAVLLMREPPRAAPSSEKEAPRGATYAALLRTPGYVSAVLGYIAQTFALGGFAAWAVFFLVRKLCFDLGTATLAFGGITVVTGLVGTAAGGVIADRIPGADRTRASLRVCAYSSLIAAPIALVALLLPSATGFLIALGACQLAIFVSVSPTNAAVLLSVPPALRASAMALSIFAIHLFGDLISPPLIGRLADAFGDARTSCSGATGLQIGMYLLPAALALSALFWFRGATRPDGQLPR
jgi:MFS transporter, Spinster family, sphingosine-1-phosphate transporter